MYTSLTPEIVSELIRFANDDKAPISENALQALNSLYGAVQYNLVKSYSGAVKRNAMLTEKIENMRARNRSVLAPETSFTDTGLDSVDVATGLLYQLQQLKTYRLGKNKINYILYEMYASWLASKGQRLFLEHPVANEWGPMFWRVYKKLDTRCVVPYDEWKRICALNPGVAAFCQNAAKKYYDYSDKTLSELFLKSEPYREARKEHNNGKWGKELSDTSIYKWKIELSSTK